MDIAVLFQFEGGEVVRVYVHLHDYRKIRIVAISVLMALDVMDGGELREVQEKFVSRNK
jgi:hypothetical protein